MVAFGEQSAAVFFSSGIGNVINYFTNPFIVGASLYSATKINDEVFESAVGGGLYFVTIKSGATVRNGYVNSNSLNNAVNTLIVNQQGEQAWTTQQVLYYNSITFV